MISSSSGIALVQLNVQLDSSRPPLLGGIFSPAESPLPHQADGMQVLMLSGFCWTLGWLALFYFVSWLWPILEVAPSTKTHENDRFWCARNVIGIIHAILVGGISFITMVLLFAEDSNYQFGGSNHLAQCDLDKAADPALRGMAFIAPAVALAGIAFITFTIADVFISMIHGFAELEFLLHHAAFIYAGVIIRTHCMLPLNASILLAMEVSTPFLNWICLFRHRDGYNHSVVACGIFFVALFILTRIILNIYGAVIFWVFRQSTMPPDVPSWQCWTLILAVTVGAAVQVFWLGPILNMFSKEVNKLLVSGSTDSPKERRRKTVKELLIEADENCNVNKDFMIERNVSEWINP